MKAKTIKARVMYGTSNTKVMAGTFKRPTGVFNQPVFVLPATREAYEGMLDQMATAMMDHDYGRSWNTAHRAAVKALAALNIKEPKA